MLSNAGIELCESVDIEFATDGDGEFKHFFGYYDKSPFDNTGDRILCHRYRGDDKSLVTSEHSCEVGFLSVTGGKFRSLGTTKAFNWQQGSMLQWLGPDFGSAVIYNDRVANRYVSRIIDIETNSVRTLERTIYSVSPDGRWAVSPNFERHEFCRPGYCYAGVADPHWKTPHDEADGIFCIDLESGSSTLIISVAQLRAIRPLSSMNTSEQYVEHMLVSPGGERFIFLHRWWLADGGIYTRMYSANRHGGELFLFPDSGNYSHQTWRNEHEVVVTGRSVSIASSLRYSTGLVRHLVRPLVKIARRCTSIIGYKATNRIIPYGYLHLMDCGNAFPMVDDGSLNDGGHPSFRPGDLDCMLSDTYPNNEGWQELYLFRVAAKKRILLGRFWSPPEYRAKGYRCDLHPRWDRSGKRVCIDSLASGSRQMYVLNVEKALG